MHPLPHTSTISHGNMSFLLGDTDRVTENRTAFLRENGIAWEEHFCMRCTHGREIVTVTSNTPVDKYRMLEAEVLVTQEAGCTLMLLTADCLPTTFFDPVTKTLALAHFSRQTIADALPEKTIVFLQTHFGVDPANLQVTVGPHIHKDSYRFPTPLQTVYEILKPYLTIESDYTYIDLPSAHNAQLITAGVPADQIRVSTIDTASSVDHYSHFASTHHAEAPGRIATIVTL